PTNPYPPPFPTRPSSDLDRLGIPPHRSARRLRSREGQGQDEHRHGPRDPNGSDSHPLVAPGCRGATAAQLTISATAENRRAYRRDRKSTRLNSSHVATSY